MVLSSPCFPSEVWLAEDSPDLATRSGLTLVIVWLGAPVADITTEVSLSDEFFNLILERNALFRGVADISMESVVFVLIPLRAVSPHRIKVLIHARVLLGQEYILTRPCQADEIIVLARRGSRDHLIRILSLLLVGVWRPLAIFTLSFLVFPVLPGGSRFSF